MTSRSTVPVTAGLHSADNSGVISRGIALVRRAGLFRPAIAAFAFLVFATSALAQDNVKIVPLVRDDAVLVSFELTDGYTPEVKDAVHSGLKTTFTYEIELRQDVPAWVDRTIAASVITNTVQYDNLTRRATLTRTLDGHVESTETTEDEAVIRQWRTTCPKMPRSKPAHLA